MPDLLITPAILLVYFVGLVGMLAHWGKRWLRGETFLTLPEYLFGYHRKNSAGAVVVAATAITGAIFGGVIDPNSASALLTAFEVGYTTDSAVNRDVTIDRRSFGKRKEESV